MLLNQITLVLAGKVIAPVAGELKLLAVLDSLLKDIDSLGVCKTYKALFEYALKALQQSLVNHVVQELQVILAVVKCPAYAVLDEVLLKVHQLLLIQESNLGLDHPELGQVARSVGVLGTECRTKGVDGAQCGCTKLTLQLTAYGKRSLLTKEIIIVYDLTLIILLEVVKVLGGYLEHVTCTLAVTCSDKRSMEIEESMLMEIGMDGHCHIVADTHHGTECIGAQTHMGMLTHVLECLALLLHGIVITAQTQHLNLLGLDLDSLTGADALDHGTLHAEAGTGGNLLHQLVAKLFKVSHNLNILDCRAVIESNEIYALASTLCSYPTFDDNLLTVIGTFEKVNNPCSLDIHCFRFNS